MDDAKMDKVSASCVLATYQARDLHSALLIRIIFQPFVQLGSAVVYAACVAVVA